MYIYDTAKSFLATSMLNYFVYLLFDKYFNKKRCFIKELITKYNFSNDYLMFKVGDVVGFMNRDITEFTARNITQADIDTFEAEGNVFETILPDSFYRSQITIEVDAKNAARESCQLQARKIAGYIEQAFGDKSGQYKSLSYGKLGNAQEKAFITGVRLVARAAEGYLGIASTYGLTQAMIDSLVAEAQMMEDKLHQVAQKEADRDIKANERVAAGNALYDKLVQYCSVGKSIWEDVNEAKYNDYVINPTVHHSLPKVQNLVAIPNSEDPFIADLTWDAVSGALGYRVYQSQVIAGSPASEFEPIEELEFTNYNAQMDPEFTFYWKVRAINANTQGTFSDVVSLTPIENNN